MWVTLYKSPNVGYPVHDVKSKSKGLAVPALKEQLPSGGTEQSPINATWQHSGLHLIYVVQFTQYALAHTNNKCEIIGQLPIAI